MAGGAKAGSSEVGGSEKEREEAADGKECWRKGRPRGWTHGEVGAPCCLVNTTLGHIRAQKKVSL